MKKKCAQMWSSLSLHRNGTKYCKIFKKIETLVLLIWWISKGYEFSNNAVIHYAKIPKNKISLIKLWRSLKCITIVLNYNTKQRLFHLFNICHKCFQRLKEQHLKFVLTRRFLFIFCGFLEPPKAQEEQFNMWTQQFHSALVSFVTEK